MNKLLIYSYQLHTNWHDESINRFPQLNKNYYENLKNIKFHVYVNCTYRFLPRIQTDD